MDNEWKDKIYYSQCWEDPYILLEGLEVQRGDRIISITSGGCNSLALLLGDPKEVIAIDANPAQNYFFELKLAAIKNLSYEDLLAFLGITTSRDRRRIFGVLEPYLSEDARLWWRDNFRLLDAGLIHVGKLEKYFRFFAIFVLPLIHSRKTTELLFIKKTREQQRDFYAKSWNTWRWRFFVKIFFGRALSSRAARNRSLYKFVDDSDIAELYLERVKNAICNDPWNNFFLHYIFIGNYDVKCLPPYLTKENIEVIKERLDRLQIVSADVFAYIAQHMGEFAKYNLSNVFEKTSPEETTASFAALLDHCAKPARLFYINHLVERTFPAMLDGRLIHDVASEESLKRKNMAFFYKKIHIDYAK